jgi:hypothetical protein
MRREWRGRLVAIRRPIFRSSFGFAKLAKISNFLRYRKVHAGELALFVSEA